MKSALSLALLSSLSWFALPTMAQFQVGDDFNHTNRDVSKWGASDEGSGDMQWSEGANRLNLISTPFSFDPGFVRRAWIGRSPSYTNDWTASVDLQLNDLAVFEGDSVAVSLRVGSAASSDDAISFTLFYVKVEEGMVFRRLTGTGFSDGNSQELFDQDYSGRTGQLRMTYDAHSRMITLSVLTSANQVVVVGTWNTLAWNMTAESSFQVSLDASAFGASFGSGQVFADNFVISEKAPRALGSLSGGDNFDDQNRSAANWGTLDSIMGTGSLAETGGGVRYSSTGLSGIEQDSAARLWFPAAGEFTKSWTAQVDVKLPALALEEANAVDLGLVVMNLADPGDRATVSLGLANDTGTIVRQFATGAQRDGTIPDEAQPVSSTTSTSAALRARWDAAAKRLLVDYDANGAVGGYQWTNLKTYDLTSGDLDWGMSAGSRFQVGILGASRLGTVVTQADGLSLDNFQVSSDGGVIAPIRIAPLKKVGNTVQLTWDGGKGPYQVQRRTSLGAGAWVNVGGSVATKQATVDIIGPVGFLQILDLGQ